MRVADAIWTATALLHQENPQRADFEVQEIVSRAVQENFAGGFRPGLQPHASWHCVANKKPNGGRYRMLFETGRGRRRLFHPGDNAHPDRNGDITPDKSELPTAHRALVDWYETVYCSRPQSSVVAALGPHAGDPDRLSPEAFGQSSSGTSIAFVSVAGAFVIPEDLRRELGIREGTRLSIGKQGDHLIVQPVTAEFVDRVAGSYRGKASMVEARERDHRIER